MIKNIMYVLGFVFMFDVLGFMFWIASGQMPVDNFHVGVITESIIKIII